MKCLGPLKTGPDQWVGGPPRRSGVPVEGTVHLTLSSAVMVIAMFTVFVIVPETPFTVTVVFPGAALVEAENVNTLVRVVEAGLKVAVTPAGSPIIDRSTVPVNPFWRLAVIVLVPVPPCAIFKLAGVAISRKPGAARTCSATVEVVRRLPEMPVMVTVQAPT